MNQILCILLSLLFVAGSPVLADEAKDKTTKDVAKPGTDPTDDDEDKTDNEVANILNSMGYPELQVVPRASERLRIEAKEERGNWFYAIGQSKSQDWRRLQPHCWLTATKKICLKLGKMTSKQSRCFRLRWERRGSLAVL